MNVAVGCFCDPEGLEGLAHFLGMSLVASFKSNFVFDFKISSTNILGKYFCYIQILTRTSSSLHEP
jgi:hypothetical protein